MITIAIIDEHPIVLTGLAYLLEQEFDTPRILKSESIESFYKSYRNQRPDLFILGMGANSAKTRHTNLKTKVIVFDYKPDQSNASFYLKAGANGYLSKQDDAKELRECIKGVLDGHRYVCKDALILAMSLPAEKKQEIRKKHAPLTYRETQIANYLCQGMKTSLIARTLERKPSTISTIKYIIYKKLEVENVVQLIHVLRPQAAG